VLGDEAAHHARQQDAQQQARHHGAHDLAALRSGAMVAAAGTMSCAIVAASR